jgi:hypothetical protein
VTGFRKVGSSAPAVALVLFLTAAILPPPLSGMPYRYPLSSTTIRDACFLGTEDTDANAQAWSLYTHTLPDLSSSFYVSSANIATPYLQVAQRCAAGPNYDEQDAVKDFLGKPAVILVRLDLYFAPVSTGATISGSGEVDVHINGLAQDLAIVLTQNDDKLKPLSVRSAAIFPAEPDIQTQALPEAIGQHVEIVLNPDEVQAAPLTIEVQLPNGRKASTTFDLSKLR